MLIERAERLLAVASDAGSDDAALSPWVNEFFDGVQESPAGEVGEALQVLSRGVAIPDGRRAALLATICGALVERGHDPSAVTDILLSRVRSAARGARRFHEAWTADAPGRDPEAPDNTREAARQALAARMPAEAREAELLESLYLPAIAVLSVSPSARVAARDLISVLAPMSEASAAARWLVPMLRVLHDEPYVAIEFASGLGIMGRMSGVSVNFQLNVLLMDVFPQRGHVTGPRVSKSAVAIARGEGPQVRDDVVVGAWNLYTWRAMRPDGTLPDSKDLAGRHSEWIWNEGVPDDIPTLDGVRVILLGPPSYERTWRASRDFRALRAGLTVERELSKADVAGWLARVASAAR